MSIIYFRNSPNEAWATIPAIKGEKGETPIKGVDYFTEEEIEAIKADIQAPEADLSNYYTKEEVDEKIDNIEVSGGAEVDLSDYATIEYVDSKDGALAQEFTAYLEMYLNDILVAVDNTYAKKTDIPDTSSFITIGDVEAKGYQTEEQVAAAINEALGVVENGSY